MTKNFYLEILKSVPGRSVLHCCFTIVMGSYNDDVMILNSV